MDARLAPPRRRRARGVAAGLLACLIAGLAAAQPEPPPRPRVGLVLGGGGARGTAHIGVLEVLQGLRVPVDCVAGTSMGALVAGAYAAGLTPAEMRAALSAADWDDMFQDNPAFYDMSYRNKRQSQLFLPSLEFGVTDDGIKYVPGVVTGQKIKAFFNQLVYADRGERLIEDLPLPLSIMATDIGTGDRVVIRDGSLTQAMRASMSVPGLMAPVERNGHQLVDGGLVDNIPIAEVRQRCRPDVVIAVNVGSPLLKPEQIGSLLSVAAQMVNILTEQNVTQSLATLRPTDIYIKPDLEGISAADFKRSDEAADRGRTAAEGAREQLLRLSVGQAEYDAWRARIDTPEIGPRRVDQIEIAGLVHVNPVDVERHISQKVGEPLRTPTLNEDLLRVYGDGYYERVDYTLITERDRNILRVLPMEKPWGPNYLRFGFGLETESSIGSTYILRAAYHKTWADALGAELLVTAQIGNTAGLAANYYQPLEATQTYFVAPQVEFKRQNVYAFQNDKRLAEMNVYDATAELPLGVRIGSLGQAKLGVEYSRKKAETAIGPSIIPPYSVSYGGWYASLDLDQLDRIYVPRSGWAVAARYFDAPSQGYSKFRGEVRGAYPVGDYVIHGRALYVDSPSGTLPWYDPATLGGFLDMTAFASNQMIGDNSAYAGLRVERILRALPLGLRGDIRLGLALEGSRMGRRYTETNLKSRQSSVAIYLGGETPLGPIFIGYGYSPSSGYSNAYLLFGTP